MFKEYNQFFRLIEFVVRIQYKGNPYSSCITKLAIRMGIEFHKLQIFFSSAKTVIKIISIQNLYRISAYTYVYKCIMVESCAHQINGKYNIQHDNSF